MHETETQEKTGASPRPKRIAAYVCHALGLLLLVSAVGAGVAVVWQLPVTDWKNAYLPTPWVGENLRIEQAQASWKNAAGDQFMALRTAYYPELTLTLGECSGEGLMMVNFRSVTGSVVGDTVHLRYTASGFVPQLGDLVQTNGKTAVCRIAKGFETKDDYTLHQLNEQEQLWRAEVRYVPQGGTPQLLGYVSVIPE